MNLMQLVREEAIAPVVNHQDVELVLVAGPYIKPPKLAKHQVTLSLYRNPDALVLRYQEYGTPWFITHRTASYPVNANGLAWAMSEFSRQVIIGLEAASKY